MVCTALYLGNYFARHFVVFSSSYWDQQYSEILITPCEEMIKIVWFIMEPLMLWLTNRGI